MKALVILMLGLIATPTMAQVKFPEYLEHAEKNKPLIHVDQLKGGYWQVDSLADRDAISDLKRAKGMVVSYSDTGGDVNTTVYISDDLTNTAWTNDNNWLTIDPVEALRDSIKFYEVDSNLARFGDISDTANVLRDEWPGDINDTANVLRSEWPGDINDTADVLRSEWPGDINDTANVLRSEWPGDINDTADVLRSEWPGDINDTASVLRSEIYWDKTGNTINPKNTDDSVKIGSGEATEKFEVDGNVISDGSIIRTGTGFNDVKTYYDYISWRNIEENIRIDFYDLGQYYEWSTGSYIINDQYWYDLHKVTKTYNNVGHFFIDTNSFYISVDVSDNRSMFSGNGNQLELESYKDYGTSSEMNFKFFIDNANENFRYEINDVEKVKIEEDTTHINNTLKTSYPSTTVEIAQFHRVDSINTSTANAWQTVKFDTKVASESTSGHDFSDDSTYFVIGYSGVLRVQGCVHYLWEGSDTTVSNLYIRVTKNDIEQRCTQVNGTKEKNTNTRDTKRYGGTISVEKNDTLRIQYQVSDTDLNWQGDPTFDNSVSWSVNFEKISE